MIRRLRTKRDLVKVWEALTTNQSDHLVGMHSSVIQA